MGFEKIASYETERKPKGEAKKLESRLKSDIEAINGLLSKNPYELDRRINSNDLDFFEKDWSEHLPPYMYDMLFRWTQKQGVIQPEWIHQRHLNYSD